MCSVGERMANIAELDIESIEEEMSAMSLSKTPRITLRSKFERCPVCLVGQMVEVKREKSEMLIYGRNGVRLAEHKEHRCSNQNTIQPCRVGAFYGYITFEGDKIYDTDCLKNEFLVTSNQTAFEISYLIEVVADIYLLQGCFESIAKKYNRLNNRHLPSATQERRMEIYRKTLTSGFFLFAFLEYGQRYGVPRWQRIVGSVEETVMEMKDDLQKSFQERWTKVHKCDRPGCESCIIIDADLKPHRMLCAARLCGIREFENSDVKVVTGCTAMPGTKNKFCFKHRSEESPVLTGKDISKETKEKLRKHRKDNAASDKAPDDKVYIIESILEITGDKYLVKWSGFEESAATWEPATNVPRFIQEYYKKDEKRLKQKLPNPKIKNTKKVGSTKMHFLSWEGEKGGQWLGEDFFDIIDGNGEVMKTTLEEVCNTRKSRDKRSRDHTVGLFAGLKPCGVVCLFSELFGSESISQVTPQQHLCFIFSLSSNSRFTASWLIFWETYRTWRALNISFMMTTATWEPTLRMRKEFIKMKLQRNWENGQECTLINFTLPIMWGKLV